MSNEAHTQPDPMRQAIEISIRLGLLILLAVWCLEILKPFISVIAWAALLAIAVHKPFLKLRAILGGRQKIAIAIFVIAGLSIVMVPAGMLSDSLYDSASNLGRGISEGSLQVPPPSETVKEWPVLGEKVYQIWLKASENLATVLIDNKELFSGLGGKVLGVGAGLGGSILQFVIATLIAGVFLGNAEKSEKAMRLLFRRLAGDHGDELVTIATSTVRSVMVGVLGIAVIQAALAALGIGFAGVPAVGLWALIILVLAIAQLPPLLVLAPISIYLFSVGSTTVAVVFLIWSILVSMSDAVLKPVLLGRGVDAPMLVILLGAIGGMLSAGIIGLFLGAVVLTLGYKLFITWLNLLQPVDGTTEALAEGTE